jgi:chemotaxis protein methyltransferase CheR
VLRRRLDRAAALAARVRLDRADVDEPDWAALLDAVTVQETQFYRNAPQLDGLRAEILPGLARAGRPLRLLSAGCATGEEAWTLGMLALDAGITAEVVGLDLCRTALAAAAAGIYQGPPDPLRNLPAEYRRWLACAAPVEPGPALRRMVRFRRANLLRLAEPAGHYDLVCCRNVLIYLTPAARAATLARLVAALRPGGALLLGPTDQPGPGMVPWADGMIGSYRHD